MALRFVALRKYRAQNYFFVVVSVFSRFIGPPLRSNPSKSGRPKKEDDGDDGVGNLGRRYFFVPILSVVSQSCDANCHQV